MLGARRKAYRRLRTRWGENLGAPRITLCPRSIRAGFEPLRAFRHAQKIVPNPAYGLRPIGGRSYLHGAAQTRRDLLKGVSPTLGAPRFSPYRSKTVRAGHLPGAASFAKIA